MNAAIVSRLDELIAVAECLRRTVEAERPGALLPTFLLMRAGVAVDAMVADLQEHSVKLTKGAKPQ
jgi:hypothetical protein